MTTTYGELAKTLQQCVPITISGADSPNLALEFSRFKDLSDQLYDTEEESGKAIFVKCVRTRFFRGGLYIGYRSGAATTWSDLKAVLDAR